MSPLAEELLALSRAREVTESAEVNRAIAWRFTFASVIGDGLMIAVGLLIGFWARFRPDLRGMNVFSPEAMVAEYLPYLGAGAVALWFLIANQGMYRPAQLLRYRQVSFLIIQGCFLWFVGVLVALKLTNSGSLFPPGHVALTSGCVLLCLLGWRAALNRIGASETFSRHLRERILFVGWNELSERLTKFVMRDPSRAYAVIGCVPPVGGNYEQEPPGEIPHIAAYRDIVSMLRGKCIDVVMLADRTATMAEIDELATTCEREHVQLKVIPSYFQILLSGLSLQPIGGIPVLGISRLPLDRPVNQIVKRAVDIVGSITGLILSAPIIAVFGTLVYLESPGSIFYRQRRVGRGGVSFDMIKIRSMRNDADKSDNLRQSTPKDDPRLLRVGQFIRRWNIDETPQFWNVLKGQMSLVGPRPERIYHSKKLSGEIPHYSARYWSKPGMTGWAAVNGLRGESDLVERIRCDLYYLENWSVWLDFQIMFLTLVSRKGAA
ncbi:MAG: sugar transferase [Chthoniobacteraceae bacterium]